ncbi:MAG: hypothetical protein Q7U03_13655 [Syntrophales bacterium]|nr:hypothetical protein [Syntrophales bacterium]
MPISRADRETKADLDPFRVILSIVAAKRDSDLLTEVASAAGLRFDASVSGDAAYSHKTRVRVLAPRIVSAYDILSEPAARGAASALIAALQSGRGSILDEATDALRRVGWDINGTDLVAVDPDIREMFFPKGSQWDAFVVLKGLFAEASREMVVVDAYCDSTVFKLLAARKQKPLTVRILCWQSATAVADEAKAFVSQFSGWVVHVHQAKDFHDRFVVLDGTSCVHIGASINGAGKTAFMISKVEDPLNKDSLIRQIEASLSASTQLL